MPAPSSSISVAMKMSPDRPGVPVPHQNHDRPDLWIPDNPDGSGWADVDWGSVARGSRYHYRHVGTVAEARAEQPAHYLVVTRLESARIRPHENRYYVPRELLADFL